VWQNPQALLHTNFTFVGDVVVKSDAIHFIKIYTIGWGMQVDCKLLANTTVLGVLIEFLKVNYGTDTLEPH
jgi:hypothetical protein